MDGGPGPDAAHRNKTPEGNLCAIHRGRLSGNALYFFGSAPPNIIKDSQVTCRSLTRRGRRVAAAAAVAVSAATVAFTVRVRAASSCEALTNQRLDRAVVAAATTVSANAAPFYAGRAFCRVQITITPTADSDIHAEVWLPIDRWNGKFEAVGNSDAAGALSYDDMAAALGRGFATSSTDTGHVGNSMAFALGHREKYVDFGYRALHEMTVKAKAIVAAYYGAPAREAYWNGCSQGGRQGITEATRYPRDYDGVIAGAPAIEDMRLHAVRLALNLLVHRGGDSYIPPEKYALIHRAALDACDSADGVRDGLITDPTKCRFDPVRLACKDGDAPTCLTPAQVETARDMYAPLRDATTGRTVSPALLEPGSELGWGRLAGPEPLRNAVEPFKYVVFNDPSWDWHTFRLQSDLPRALQVDGGVINLTDPDLHAFFARGGRLLLYHGWADPQIPPLDTVDYFNAVLKTSGASTRGRSIQLYMLPGVSHCEGGEGPDRFDAVGALDEWVDRGRAPARIVAARRTQSTVVRTRPLCPYPARAVYVGSGSIDRAENFRCETDAASRIAQAPAAPASFEELARRSVARYDGTVNIKGLTDQVDVLRDEWGIPHIYARNIDDLFMAQGFVVAHDRLWQMELGRRLAEGRISELIGRKGLAHDRLYRTFKFRGPWDDAEWTNYHPEGRRIFAAFARGINAFIAEAGDNLPVEFKLTGIRPEPWKAEEILVRNRVVMAVQEARREVRLAESVAAHGAAEANRRAHPEPYGDLVTPPGVDLSLINDSILDALGGDLYGTFPKPDLLPQYRNWPGAQPSADRGMPERSPGSNNLAVEARLSSTGHAFMVDDPHREVTMPALRYIVHLNAPGWNVAGATEPGLPGVIRGHNERIAWGRTASDADEADIYVEQVNPANANEVRWNGRWEPLQIVKETIPVKGEKDVVLTVKIGRHGPLFHEDPAHHVAYALRTSMLARGTAEYLGALRLDQAASARECLTDSRYLRAPATNLVCADADGHVAFRVSAAVPERANWNGRLPVPGTGAFEWGPFRDDLPEEYDPARGWIATANNNVQPPGFKNPIFFSSQGLFRRYDRLASLLSSGTRFTLDDMRRIILDMHNTEADELQPLLRGWTASTADLEKARALIETWDGEMRRDSAAAALFMTWRAAINVGALKASSGADRSRIAETGLREAIAKLERSQGADWGAWRWGRINRSAFPHPLVSAYDLPAVERDGGGGTVNAIGSVYRLITDFSDLDRSLVTIGPGESGQPGSPYYGNLLKSWSDRQLFQLAFSRPAVDAHTKHRLVLKPAP